MHPSVIDPTQPEALAAAVGSVIVEELTIERRRAFHKGHLIEHADLATLARLDRAFHVVWLDEGDVLEDAAGVRLAAAISGGGVGRTEPKLSRVNVFARSKGLLRIDGARLTEINRLPGIGIFSLVDRLTVLPGTVLAGAKITPVAIPDATLREAERIATGEPIVQVKAFRPLAVAVISTERLEGRPRDRFQESVRAKIGWFGGRVLAFDEVEKDVDAVRSAIEQAIAEGAQLVLTAGGNAIDPLDPALLALPALRAEMIKLGAPAHPGSMFWLAYVGDTPIFNLASCSMYSRATSADLILPWIMAGERVTLDDVAALGFGGLLEGKEMSYRFPPYDVVTESPV